MIKIINNNRPVQENDFFDNDELSHLIFIKNRNFKTDRISIKKI